MTDPLHVRLCLLVNLAKLPGRLDVETLEREMHKKMSGDIWHTVERDREAAVVEVATRTGGFLRELLGDEDSKSVITTVGIPQRKGGEWKIWLRWNGATPENGRALVWNVFVKTPKIPGAPEA